MRDGLTLCAPCLMGVEGLLADELKNMGCENVRAENGRVLFSGGVDIMARANIRSRLGERVLILAGEFEARSFEELFQGVTNIPWEDYIGEDDSFPVTGSSLSSALHSVPDCQSIVKKAIVERLKRKYGVSWFSETGTVRKIRFRILKDKVSVMIDTSGEGLHKRGYRRDSAAAPMKETLAAALVQLSRVRSDGTVFDPFCGSGTLLIEAAMYAANIAPGLKRHFQAELWNDIPKSVWKAEREKAESEIRKDVTFTAAGFDIDPACVELTRENAVKAGVGKFITAGVRDIKDFSSDSEYGCVICNPPYGERLLDVETARQLYGVMGKIFVPKRGWSYGIITPEEEFERIYGRKADKRRKLYNGMIKCTYYQYFKYDREGRQ